jgi:hypothetical protein
MATIRVIAKVDGVHAVTGLVLVTGQEYEIAEEHFGEEVFKKLKSKGAEAPADDKREA